jgi:hypothetical protein
MMPLGEVTLNRGIYAKTMRLVECFNAFSCQVFRQAGGSRWLTSVLLLSAA